MAIVKKYAAKIASVKKLIEGVYTLDLCSLNKPFKYEPGQFLHLALDEYDPSAAWPESRCFSIQTSPANEILRITYAVKGNFTCRMAAELKPGSVVTIKLPFGDLFTQMHNKENTIFLSGGTGITPFLSLFNDNSFAGYQHPVLFAGFRTKAMNLYEDEIDVAKKINPTMQVEYYYEDENGIINLDNVLFKSNKQSTFFISGPPAMIQFFKKALFLNGIAEELIKTDDWE